MVFVAVHVVTSIVDPFAGLSAIDAVVPFLASYRPLWLGLGVIAIELIIAITVTSFLRRRLSRRAWYVVHLLSYVAWPIAVLHTIGTGTDTRTLWGLVLDVACVGAVAVMIVWRLGEGWPRNAVLRAGGMLLSLASIVALAAWMASGPLQPGWARAAGTPSNLLAPASTSSDASSP